jgi:hypothetical protein
MPCYLYHIQYMGTNSRVETMTGAHRFIFRKGFANLLRQLLCYVLLFLFRFADCSQPTVSTASPISFRNHASSHSPFVDTANAGMTILCNASAALQNSAIAGFTCGLCYAVAVMHATLCVRVVIMLCLASSHASPCCNARSIRGT